MTTRFELANFLINNKTSDKFYINEQLIILEEYELDITKGVLELKKVKK